MRNKKRANLIKEFRDFINKGNIVDMAAGIIVGSAFTAIVNSLVNDVVMPLISSIIKVDITSAKVMLVSPEYNEIGEEIKAGVYLNYGIFIQNIINFLIIAVAIFFAIRTVTNIKNAYTNHQIKYIKKLKKRHPEYFDENSEMGALLYERLKTEHPEAFKNEEAKKVEEKKEEVVKDPLTINNELLVKINNNLENINSKLDKK